MCHLIEFSFRFNSDFLTGLVISSNEYKRLFRKIKHLNEIIKTVVTNLKSLKKMMNHCQFLVLRHFMCFLKYHWVMRWLLQFCVCNDWTSWYFYYAFYKKSTKVLLVTHILVNYSLTSIKRKLYTKFPNIMYMFHVKEPSLFFLKESLTLILFSPYIR